MTSRRRAASRSASPPANEASLSPSPQRRQSREVRISTGSATSAGGSSARLSSTRTRRPTPMVRRPRGARLSEMMPHDHDDHDRHNDHHHRRHHGHDHHHDGEDEDEDSSDGHEQHEGHSHGRQVSLNASRSSSRGRTGGQVSLTTSRGSRRTALDGSPLTWYERLLPECLLNMTAPITGYESALDETPELSQFEYEILERERLRRNRRVRRRLFAIALVASLASAFFIYRGRVPYRRAPGVRGAITAMTSRLEDGLSKTLHDTMGK